MFVRSCNYSVAKCLPSSCIGRSLLRPKNQLPFARSSIALINTSSFSSSGPEPSLQKNRNWAYLFAGAFTGVCLQKAYRSLRKKTHDVDDANVEEFPKPTSSYSSGTYKASYYNPIPPNIVQKMAGKSYKEGCPIPITDLAYVRVTHIDMKGQICTGELVVHKKIADAIMVIFKDLYDAKFPIEKIRLIDEYGADDELSMRDNNSSAFCFRWITNRPGVVSNHSLGIAVDINTFLNPYVKGDIVAPSTAKDYVDRTLNVPGMIKPGDEVIEAFEKWGFEWGGNWVTLKDYQHFEHDRTKLKISV